MLLDIAIVSYIVCMLLHARGKKKAAEREAREWEAHKRYINNKYGDIYDE